MIQRFHKDTDSELQSITLTMVKIKKINIKEFGPIKNFELELSPHNVNIIYGDNESGKTMILDAILNTLFSPNSLNTNFEGIRNQTPKLDENGKQSAQLNKLDGSVELEIDNKSLTFPQENSLDKTISIPPIFARNLFVVREGETNFISHDNWWKSIKNNLSGNRDEDIKIADNIRNSVGLESDGNWINSPERPILDCHKKLNADLEEISIIKSEVTDLARLIKQRSEIDEKYKLCQEKLSEQKKARNAFLYIEGKNLLEKYNLLQEKSVKVEKYRTDKLKIWCNTETEILKAKQILELSKKHRDKISNIANNNIKDIELWKKTIDRWDKMENDVIFTLESKLVDYKQKETKVQRGSTGKVMMPLWIILSAISAISITYVSLVMSQVFFPVAGILYIALGFSVKTWWSSKNIGTQLDALEREIKEAFKNISKEINDTSIDDINTWLTENRNTIHTMQKNVRQTKENQLPDIENVAKELTSSINNLESKLQKLNNYTTAFKISTHCSSWEDLQAKCNEKETIRVSLDMISDQISRLLDTKFEEEWESRLIELESFKDFEIEWNKKVANQLEEASERLVTRLNVLNEKISSIENKLARFKCRSHADLWIKEDEIKEELLKLKVDREAALTATNIIETISREQDNLVNEIISTGSDSTTTLFSKITDNRYKEVFLDKNKIYATTTKDETISIDQLSSGTRSQLYFALRINLAENLLQSKTAFLLLDDPFLSCDDKRTDEMISILHKITKKGWQLIYFTMSKSVVKMFENHFKNDLNICRL